jgi:uncharacterized paraquat-inducible protein A
MNKVQAALYDYFSQKPFLNSVMNIDYVWYGAGALLLFVGSIFSFAGSVILAALGLYLFWAGVLLGFAKKNEIGLTIAFGAYALIYFVAFIISFVNVFTYAAVMLTVVFAVLIHIAVAVLLLIWTIKGSQYYSRYQVQKQQQAAAYAAQAAAYAAQAKTTAAPARYCTVCNGPMAAGAVFCPLCGSRQEVKLIPVCPGCGAELKEGAAFCVKCGTKIEA